jgi:sec-independent protein translocase protein TatA
MVWGLPIGPFSNAELALIFLVILLILGPSKLPSLARGLGEAIREFRRSMSGEVSREIPEKKIRSGKITDEELKKLAVKLGVDTEGKKREEIIDQVIEKAREKGLLSK